MREDIEGYGDLLPLSSRCHSEEKKNMKSSLRFKFLVALAILAISGLAAAQDEPGGDPPSRVMRLQYLQGEVSMQPGGVDDWVAANLNRPLTTADRIWTDQGAHAELTMGSAALRLGSETSVTLSNLDDNTAQIELDQGALNLSVRYLNAGEIIEVDTPNFAYTVTKPGDYRFDVVPDADQSWITVRHGDGEATGEGNAVRVHSGQQFRFSGQQSLAYTAGRVPGPDGFDDWCNVRERREESSASARYVAAGTVGYEDLDDSGNWEPTPMYGTVWYPRVHSGWAPYREGHWAWVEPWGWTWVDDAPWGFAPFHYGRWVCVHDRWGWVPGPVGVRPVYAPALVAWVGGPSFGVSIGIGNGVGWFPLGYRDPYLPSYRVSPRYARNVNISNSREVNVTVVNNYYTTNNVNVRNTTINNIRYENAGVRGAVTGTQSSTFAAGKPVGRSYVVVPQNAVGRSNVMTAAAVVPTKEAVLGGHPPARVPQHLVAPRQVISRKAPPPRPVSFDQQRPLLEKNNGVPLSPETRNNLRRSNPPPAARSGQPAGNQPPANQGRLPGMNQPGGNQQGRSPVVNRPDGNQQFGRPLVANQPAMRNEPNNAPNRPANQAPPAGREPAANVNQGDRPGHNVPRPPQAGGNNNGQLPVMHPNDSQVNSQRNPGSSYGNPGRGPGAGAPVDRNAPVNREAAPVRDTPPPVRPSAPPHSAVPNRDVAPERNAAPARESAPVRPAPPAREAAPMREAAPVRTAPPAREAASPREAAPVRNAPQQRDAAQQRPAPAPRAEPAQQHRNAPPPGENKDNKDKEKDK